MILNEKEKIILSALLNSQDFLSVKELSKLTNIKERTLYREIKNLENSIANQKFKIEKEKSKYKISGDIKNIDISFIDTTIKQGYTLDNKINLILCDLLFNDETSIKEISEKLYLSYNTVFNTIKNLENILNDYKLKLVRKKGAGISLIGEELDKRILIISILCNEIKDNEFFTILNNSNDFSSNPFIKFLDITFIRKIYYENKNLNIFNLYTDSSIKKILISINVSIIRNDFDIVYNKNNNSDLEKEYVKEILKNIKKYAEFEYLRNIESFESFLLIILKTCKLIEQVTYFNDKYSYTLIYKINSLIENVSRKSDINFNNDNNLAKGLIAHIETAIKRYQLKLVEENNDLKDFVLKNYNELYLIIKSEIIKTFSEIKFNATELSYIVLHFASSYEQIYRENFVRALVICSSGIGSSKILGSLIRKNIPEIKNLEYSTPIKLKEDLTSNYDIIISTIKLEDDIDYILIPTILRDEDILKIKNKLLKVRSFKNNSSVAVYKDFTNTYNSIAIIMKNFEIKEQTTNENNIDDMLKDAFCNYKKIKINNEDTLIKKLINRHEKSSVVIPESNIALFHTLEDSIGEPIVIIYKVSSKLILKNVLDKKEQIKNFIIMASPNDEKYTELLGQISIAILHDNEFKLSLETNNEIFIKNKMELILTKYLLTKNN